jgi:2-polyprenyl-3-methyl-5-hydroxy-6-metoxy-1,4-benzoquinol methylase
VPEKYQKSSKEMWEAMHAGNASSGSYPQPERFRGNFDLVDRFLRLVPDGRGRRLLEMGCGGSKWLPWFAREMGYEVEGVDYSPRGCINARQGLDAANVTGTIHCVDFLQLGSEFDGKYDVVTSFGVIEHFVQPAAILRLFARCLRRDGLALTFVPNMAGLYGELIKRFDRTLYDTHVLFDLQQLASFHEQAGLEILHAAYTGWADFQSIPVDRFGAMPGLVLKNLIYAWNRSLLVAYRGLPGFRPQSPYFCDSMLVLAKAPASNTSSSRH